MAQGEPHVETAQDTITSAIERETKLSVDRRFRLPKLKGQGLPQRVLTSTYYDTSNYRLAHAKITLRRRTENRRSVWQLKLPCDTARREIEMPGAAGAPPAALQDLLVVHLQGQGLIPVATLRTWRTGIRVHGQKDASADVVLDRVSVLKDRHVAHSFRELEIERVSGKDDLRSHLEETLRKSGAGDHDGRPKLFRALELPAPHPTEPPPVEAPAIEHLRFILMQHVEVLRVHDPGTRLGGEIEDVHAMRVSTRRLRAILRAARPLVVPGWGESLRTELAWLGELLGPARDLDVQLKYFREEAAALEARDRRPLERFVAHLRTEREKAQHALVAELKSSRYLKLIDKFVQAAQEPAVVMSTETLCDIAAADFMKLRKARRKLGGAPSDSALHRMRIKTKRARYAAELAETSRGKQAKSFIMQAKVFQNLLGVHQDAVLAEQHIRKFSEQSTSVRAAFVAGRMVERQHQRRESARITFRAQWKKLDKRGKKAWG
ncbi:MAG: CYTH and CHAD domain-containing protein [Nitrospirales bacterium]|nr:CYTH and CHAD domain-containing protein [Nitrospirales bacterium]